MNLGQRISGAFAALSGALSSEVAVNTANDNSFRGQTEATLTALGALTTELKAKLDELQAEVDAGNAIDPDVFADIKSKVDSLDEAFPDTEVLPPEDDEEEAPIEDEGSTTGEGTNAGEGFEE